MSENDSNTSVPVPQLSYYFNNEHSFYYNQPSSLFNGDVIQITMPNNDSSKSVINLTDKGTISYYTLNSMYISLNMNKNINEMYQLILQGNKNDYANNSTHQILIIIPIFNIVTNTIEGSVNSITTLNNLYISSIFNNMSIGETYNFTSGKGNESESIDINKFLLGVNKGILYSNLIDSNTNINYNVIQFEQSNIYYNVTNSVSVLSSLLKSIPNPSDAAPISPVQMLPL
jgi:hypothetical protein